MKAELFARRISVLRELRRLTQKEFAEQLGVSQRTTSRWETGAGGPPKGRLPEIYSVLRVTEEQFWDPNWFPGTRQDTPLSTEDVITPLELSGEIVRLPVVAEVHAGKPQEVIEEEGDYIVIDRDFLPNGGEYFAVRVQGQSMMGVGITEGDLAIIRRQPVLEPGQIGVVDIEGEGACIKRVHFDGENVILSSANDKYAPRVLHSSRVRIVGILKLLHRQFVQ